MEDAKKEGVQLRIVEDVPVWVLIRASCKLRVICRVTLPTLQCHD